MKYVVSADWPRLPWKRNTCRSVFADSISNSTVRWLSAVSLFKIFWRLSFGRRSNSRSSSQLEKTVTSIGPSALSNLRVAMLFLSKKISFCSLPWKKPSIRSCSTSFSYSSRVGQFRVQYKVTASALPWTSTVRRAKSILWGSGNTWLSYGPRVHVNCCDCWGMVRSKRTPSRMTDPTVPMAIHGKCATFLILSNQISLKSDSTVYVRISVPVFAAWCFGRSSANCDGVWWSCWWSQVCSWVDYL